MVAVPDDFVSGSLDQQSQTAFLDEIAAKLLEENSPDELVQMEKTVFSISSSTLSMGLDGEGPSFRTLHLQYAREQLRKRARELLIKIQAKKPKRGKFKFRKRRGVILGGFWGKEFLVYEGGAVAVVLKILACSKTSTEHNSHDR